MRLIRYQPRASYNPFALARSLQDEIDRRFSETFFGDEEMGFALSPTIDVRENENEVTVHAELPGLGKDDFDLFVENDVLVLKGEKKEEKEKSEGDYSYRERRFGSFRREIPLPSTADAEKIGAKLANGILTITVPKKEEAKPRQITVNVN